LDGDGLPEIMAATYKPGGTNFLYVWHTDGSLLQGWPVNLGEEVINSPAIGDVDGDGKPEVVATTYADFTNNAANAWVHVWKANGDNLLG
jgi:hypothetical protein